MNPLKQISQTIDQQSPVVRAAYWTILSAFFVIIYTSLAKHLARDLPIPVIVFVRCIFGMILFAPLFLPYLLPSSAKGAQDTGSKSLKTDRPWLMLSRGVSTMVALYCIFSAVSLIPIATVVAVQYSKPFVVTILAVLILREIMTGARWLTLAIGFAGMLLIVQPGVSGFEPRIWHLGILLAIGAMLAEAYGSITLKILTRTNSPDRTVAYLVMGMLAASAIPGLWYWQTPTLAQFGWLAAAAVSANVFQQCMARGFAAADATVVVPFEFSRLVFAAIFGAVFFGEIASLWTWLGAAVILSGALWLAHMEKKARR